MEIEKNGWQTGQKLSQIDLVQAAMPIKYKIILVPPILFLAAASIPITFLISEARLSAWPSLWVNGPWEHAIIFTIRQSLLSSIIALVLSLPAAYIIANYKFALSKLLERICTIAFFTPSLVLILGFVLVFGQNGLINNILSIINPNSGGKIYFLYRLSGIILAHVFLNLAIPIRFISASLKQIPHAYTEEARISGANHWQRLFYILLPLLIPSILASLSLVFLYCFSSFSIILVLGGLGSTSLELEIYRFFNQTLEFNAAGFGVLLQLTFLGILVLLYSIFEGKVTMTLGEFSPDLENKKTFIHKSYRPFVFIYSILILSLVLLPLLAIIWESLHNLDPETGKNSWSLYWYLNVLRTPIGIFKNMGRAFLNSLILSIATGILASLYALALAKYGRMLKKKYSVNKKHTPQFLMLNFLALFPLLLSPVVLASSFVFIGMQLGLASYEIRFLLLLSIHLLIAMPLAFKLLYPSIIQLDQEVFESAILDGINSFHRFIFLEWPLLKPSFLSSFLLTAAISLGEVNAVIAIGASKILTVPLMIYQLLGHYRFGQGSVLAVALMLIAFSMFAITELLTRDKKDRQLGGERA